MNHRQDKSGGPAHLSRIWLLVWFVLQWLVVPAKVALMVAYYVIAFLGDASGDNKPHFHFAFRDYLGPRRFAREWSRDPGRWEEHFRALLPTLREEATKFSVSPGGLVEHRVRARIKYMVRLIRAEGGERSGSGADVAFMVPVHHYRGCGPEAARRIARADGWRILAPGTSTGNGLAPKERHGLVLAIPHPRMHPTPPPTTPSGKP
ncbi:hypothetical protein AB0B79_20265 [Streptomyces sp. NPDC039022]|uniref:hypothetical protein n=1 Tax=unclassified Streptomyces TaxID=2593676 RepID=UPI0033FECA67